MSESRCLILLNFARHTGHAITFVFQPAATSFPSFHVLEYGPLPGTLPTMGFLKKISVRRKKNSPFKLQKLKLQGRFSMHVGLQSGNNSIKIYQTVKNDPIASRWHTTIIFLNFRKVPAFQQPGSTGARSFKF